MPANWANTPEKEKAWNKAKKAFKKQYDKEPESDKDYAIIMNIAKKMHKGESFMNYEKNISEKNVSPYVKDIAKKTGKDINKIEKFWNKAKKITMEDFGISEEDKLETKHYNHMREIVYNLLGLKEDSRYSVSAFVNSEKSTDEFITESLQETIISGDFDNLMKGTLRPKSQVGSDNKNAPNEVKQTKSSEIDVNSIYKNKEEPESQEKQFEAKKDGTSPDGTGPHGRGSGPGKGKADGSGMKKDNDEDKKKKKDDEDKEVKEQKAPKDLKIGIKDVKKGEPIKIFEIYENDDNVMLNVGVDNINSALVSFYSKEQARKEGWEI